GKRAGLQGRAARRCRRRGNPLLRHHAQGPPLQPRGLRRGALGRMAADHVRHGPRARRPAQGQVGARRIGVLPPLLRPRCLWLRRHADQRPQPARLQDPAEGPRHLQADPGRADQGPAGGKGPHRGHGAVLPVLPRDHAVPDHQGPRAHQGTPAVRRGPRAVRRHDQVHPLRRVHVVLPRLLDRRPVLRSGGHRQCAPLHLRLARRCRRHAPRDPERQGRRVALPHHLQLHGRLPPRHPGHQGHRRGQAGHPDPQGL
ncbi:MAG: Succinate dehydrogenase iron-sulfur protein, partial [uncultured Arthrobacter sp.]